MTPQERKVMDLALEALEKLTNAAEGFSVSGVYFNEELWSRKCLDDAYDAMGFAQEALAQPEKEPVTYSGNGTAGREADARPTGFFFQMPKPVAQPEQEPVTLTNTILRRTSTPPQRKPLTRGQIREIEVDVSLNPSFDYITPAEQLCRAIEAAHGIKE